MDPHIDIDLRGRPGDIRFECDVCHWAVTLSPAAAAQWTAKGTIEPRCRRDDRPLTRTVITEDPR